MENRLHVGAVEVISASISEVKDITKSGDSPARHPLLSSLRSLISCKNAQRH